MLKINVTLELDEEQLRDIFESLEIKFSKKKAKELQEEVDSIESDIQIMMQDTFEEIISNTISDFFE
jgi:hypothetical protein